MTSAAGASRAILIKNSSQRYGKSQKRLVPNADSIEFTEYIQWAEQSLFLN